MNPAPAVWPAALGGHFSSLVLGVPGCRAESCCGVACVSALKSKGRVGITARSAARVHVGWSAPPPHLEQGAQPCRPRPAPAARIPRRPGPAWAQNPQPGPLRTRTCAGGVGTRSSFPRPWKRRGARCPSLVHMPRENCSGTGRGAAARPPLPAPPSSCLGTHGVLTSSPAAPGSLVKVGRGAGTQASSAEMAAPRHSMNLCELGSQC